MIKSEQEKSEQSSARNNGNRRRNGRNEPKSRSSRRNQAVGDSKATPKSSHGWQAIEPDLSVQISALAGEDDALGRVKRLAEYAFDASNSTVEASQELEEIHRVAAAKERIRLDRIYKEKAAEPEVNAIASAETEGTPSGWNKFWGGVGLVGLGALLLPIPLIVSQGIAQSYALDSISDDWRLGIPVGIPVLCGILASGLLRQTLSHNARINYDRFVSVAGVVALGGWAAGFAHTFLAPFDAVDAFGGESGIDLRLFYAIHLGLEITASLGLSAMAERGFSAGQKVIHVVNKGVDLLTDRIEASLRRVLHSLRQAEVCKDRRARLAAARAGYVEKCLAELSAAKSRRGAAMAASAVSFGNSPLK